jgi:hypothetical protein
LRCNIFEDEFIYRIINASTIKILKHSPGNEYRGDWEQCVGLDEFPKRSFALRPIKREIQALFDKRNRWSPAPEDKFAEDDEREMRKLLKPYNDQSIRRADHAVVNQIGGRAYLYQGLMFPECEYCKQRCGESRKMLFLANLCNDERHGFIVARDVSEYIYSFICPDCRTVHIDNACT